MCRKDRKRNTAAELFLFPISGAMSNGLRAAGDVKFAMCCDWAVHSICICARCKSGKWKTHTVI